MPKMQRHGRGPAFTLVELLLVISIIVLLIAMIMPTLGSLHEDSRILVCRSRLEQIGKASIVYRTTWRRSLGLVEYNSNGSVKDDNDNMVSLVPHVDGLQVFTCPSTSNYLSSISRLTVSPNGRLGDHPSYEAYGHFDTPRILKNPTNIQKNASRIWLVFDQDNPDGTWKMTHADNHGALGGNVLYADGHADWVEAWRGSVNIWENSRMLAQTYLP